MLPLDRYVPRNRQTYLAGDYLHSLGSEEDMVWFSFMLWHFCFSLLPPASHSLTYGLLADHVFFLAMFILDIFSTAAINAAVGVQFYFLSLLYNLIFFVLFCLFGIFDFICIYSKFENELCSIE